MIHRLILLHLMLLRPILHPLRHKAERSVLHVVRQIRLRQINPRRVNHRQVNHHQVKRQQDVVR